MKKVCAVVLAVATMALAGCPKSGAYRPNHSLDRDRYEVSCEGDFDQPPVLSSGKAPYFPVSMLSPGMVDDRRMRHLPLKWTVTTTFMVGVDGKTSAIQATPTQPQSFSDHVAIAVRSWRFVPASKDGVAVASQCSNEIGYSVD